MKPFHMFAWITLAGLLGWAVGAAVDAQFTRHIGMQLKNVSNGVSYIQLD